LGIAIVSAMPGAIRAVQPSSAQLLAACLILKGRFEDGINPSRAAKTTEIIPGFQAGRKRKDLATFDRFGE
jgi:hypothetical protein